MDTEKSAPSEQERPRAGGTEPSEAPATLYQRTILKLAIAEEWLQPNPFGPGKYETWKNLTAKEADQLLETIPPERMAVLEKKALEKKRDDSQHPIARQIGRSAEEMIREIGRTIDGGF